MKKWNQYKNTFGDIVVSFSDKVTIYNHDTVVITIHRNGDCILVVKNTLYSIARLLTSESLDDVLNGIDWYKDSLLSTIENIDQCKSILLKKDYTPRYIDRD